MGFKRQAVRFFASRILRIVGAVALLVVASLSLNSVHAQGDPACPADVNANQAVDLDDLVTFNTCLEGPGVTPIDSICALTDANQDNSVDLADFARMQLRFGECPCPPEWASGFHLPGVAGGVSGFAVFDDGTGPALYMAGVFTSVGDLPIEHIAKWDGKNWSAVGRGKVGDSVFSGIRDLIVFDDGTGSALYAASDFDIPGVLHSDYVTKWDGSTWSPVGTQQRHTVHAFDVFDDGTGPALVAAGYLPGRFGGADWNVMKWDGKNWSVMGTGMDDEVYSLSVWDDGSGPALYASGKFNTAGGVSLIQGIAKWDGTSWSALRRDISSNYGSVSDTIVFDDGTGSALYVGGQHGTDNGGTNYFVAKWNGFVWSQLGESFDSFVASLGVLDDGSGPKIHAGGKFTTADGNPANRIAKWDGSTWSNLGAGLNHVPSVLAAIDNGTGQALYVGGTFSEAGGVNASGVARWDGNEWSTLSEGGEGFAVTAIKSRGFYTTSVLTFAVFDDGTGPALYAGGLFGRVGDACGNSIAKWNGTDWSALGVGVNFRVFCLTVFDDGTGPALYVGGYFESAGGVAANNIAKWDGKAWSAVGTGVDDAIYTMHVFDDGNGPALYVGGVFVSPGQFATLRRVAKWDGEIWSPLGLGLPDNVFALTTFDDGSGLALYAAGSFTETVSGLSVDRIAKWDGKDWSSVSGGFDGRVTDLVSHEDGDRRILYASGSFTRANVGHVTDVRNIAQYDGVSWSGGNFVTDDTVHALAIFNDGYGDALYVGGRFASVGLDNESHSHIARWNGSNWSSLGSGLPVPFGFGIFDDGTGPALFVGGGFSEAGGKISSKIAKWSRPSKPCPPAPTDTD